LYLRFRLAADAAKTYYDNEFSVVLQDNYYGEEICRILDTSEQSPEQSVEDILLYFGE
jgi:hypothetical protein